VKFVTFGVVPADVIKGPAITPESIGLMSPLGAPLKKKSLILSACGIAEDFSAGRLWWFEIFYGTSLYRISRPSRCAARVGPIAHHRSWSHPICSAPPSISAHPDHVGVNTPKRLFVSRLDCRPPAPATAS